MSTDTSSALDQPTMTAATPKPPRDKVMRIATMTKQLLDEVRTQPLDTASLDRLRTIDTQIIGELLTDLSPDLRQELQRLALPLTRHTELSDAELRLAHAQLVVSSPLFHHSSSSLPSSPPTLTLTYPPTPTTTSPLHSPPTLTHPHTSLPPHPQLPIPLPPQTHPPPQSPHPPPTNSSHTTSPNNPHYPHHHPPPLASRASPDNPDCPSRSTRRPGERLTHRPGRNRHIHVQRHPHLTEPP